MSKRKGARRIREPNRSSQDDAAEEFLLTSMPLVRTPEFRISVNYLLPYRAELLVNCLLHTYYLCSQEHCKAAPFKLQALRSRVCILRVL